MSKPPGSLSTETVPLALYRGPNSDWYLWSHTPPEGVGRYHVGVEPATGIAQRFATRRHVSNNPIANVCRVGRLVPLVARVDLLNRLCLTRGHKSDLLSKQWS